MISSFSDQEKVKRKEGKVKEQESPMGVCHMVSPSSLLPVASRRHAVRGLAFFLFTFSLFLLVWPATGYSQSSYRRDRSDRSRRDPRQDSRQDYGQPGSGRPETASRPGTTPAAAPQAGRITGPAEPNAAAKTADRRSSRSVERPVERSSVRHGAQDEQWAKYNLILQRNMFSRYRVPPPRQDDTPPPPRPTPNPESYYLLRGIVQENSQFIAFVEDKQTGSVLRLRQGDRVARGEIKSLTLDSLKYQFQDKTITVTLGLDLEGGQGAVTADELASYAPVAAPAGAQAAPPADEAEILKRLMEQRQKQMGQ